jgi:hypothetical protein
MPLTSHNVYYDKYECTRVDRICRVVAATKF